MCCSLFLHVYACEKEKGVCFHFYIHVHVYVVDCKYLPPIVAIPLS